MTEHRPREERAVHSRRLKIALAVEESRAYWAHVDPDVPLDRRFVRAFEERWFGAKSMDRARVLLIDFAARYDAYPGAVGVLRRWPGMDPDTRRMICHWHLQLSDPMYREFTGKFLPERAARAAPINHDVVYRWVARTQDHRWAPATEVQFASKLLSAATEAGLVGPGREARTPVTPPVPDRALAYLMYLLRGLEYEGTILANPYLRSAGLEGTTLEVRLKDLPGLAFHRMGDLTDLDFAAPDLGAWLDLAVAQREAGHP